MQEKSQNICVFIEFRNFCDPVIYYFYSYYFSILKIDKILQKEIKN